MILVYGGVQVDAAETSPARFPETAVADVAERCRRLLSRVRPRMVLGAAASGADLLIARAARLEKVPVRLVLPHDRATFRRTSVESRGAAWTDRYDRLLLDLADPAVEEHDDAEGTADVYRRHNRRMLDRAAALAEPDEQVWCLVVRPAASEPASVSDDLAAAAEERGVLTLDLDPTATPEGRPTAFVAMPYGRKFDPDTRRFVDCDATFDRVYVPVLEDLDLEWQRADLEADSGIIHIGMIDALASSDLVVADLLTGNANVAYELGIRHALARRATVVTRPRVAGVSTVQSVPFDLRPNRHVTFAVDRDGVTDDEATAAVTELRRVLQGVLASATIDSPVLALFERDEAGRLRRRSDLDDDLSTESALRAEVRAAISSSSVDRLRAAAARLDAETLPEHALLGLRLQLAVALSDEGALDEAEELFHRAEPGATDALRLTWLQQRALLLGRSGQALAEAGGAAGDPVERWSTAEQLLNEARTSFGDSEETCGIAAGVAKRQFGWALEHDDPVDAEAALQRMASLYRAGFLAEPSYYDGVNLVAALRLDLQHFGHDAAHADEIRQTLPVALFFAVREARADPRAFWPAVTVAELALHDALLGDRPDLGEPERLYAAASAIVAPRAWRKAAADQLRLFARCGDDPGAIDRLLRVLDR
ncbi:hypothetical protein OEB99_12795 [Actinotalea sp. M2MS4P-6]|uniref:tetratricopeptide repeat-containing protein n=1 Tax=Actinotalea sp. M2MS4P-6 TaxID=2983762 RepID=UPI0021E367FB|nr:tetratricopeptide repeat-containing protein [Actinotalea sp. M2MS4P-6]MCV2395188.1 hypothetical protein [Actinotalea sp. M2MS4P-6]